MNAEQFIEENYYCLKIDCNRDIQTIYQALEDYAKSLQLLQTGVSVMLCGSFDPDNRTSSATKCKCGREKWEHPKPRN